MCERCLRDLETAYRRSVAYYVRYLERIEYEPHAEYPEAAVVLARRMVGKPVVVW
jgi:hypothetical protein